MLKRQSKVLSIALIFVFCMSFMVAGFAAPDTASAVEYKGSIQPYLQKGADNVMTGQLEIRWDFMSNTTGHAGIITLPSGLEFSAPGATGSAVYLPVSAVATGGTIAPTYTWLSNKEVKLELTPSASLTEVTVSVVLPPVDVDSDATTGEAYVDISHLAGLFAPGKAHVANISGGQVLVSVVDTRTFEDGNPEQVQLTIKEDSQQGLESVNGTLKVKLPKGYAFNDGFDPTIVDVATNAAPAGGGFSFGMSDDDRTLTVHRNNTALGKSIFRLTFEVVVDSMEAEVGDCVVNLSGKSTVLPGSVTIGSFADYGYTIKVEDEDKEILAGRNNDEDSVLSKITIKENVGGSLLNSRTLIMTLPDGVEWIRNAADPVAINVDTKTLANGMDFGIAETVRNRPNVAKVVLQNGPMASKGEMEFEAWVAVAVDYEGPVTIEFSGSAGINDTITVANVVKGLTATADPVDVKIGSQDQPGADIVISEVKAETLLSDGAPALTITAPAGVGFSKLPTVTVTEGDITLGTVTRAAGIDGTRNNIVIIPIRSATSKTAATLTVSNVFYTLDRTVAEGPMKLTVGGDAINEAGITNRGTAVSVVAANCVTPAPNEGTVGAATGEFKIDSNIYKVNGVARVMDANAYIKGDRTYVPVRYVAYAAGLDDNGIAWDADTQKVTLTQGDNVVELVVGSNTIIINGEAQTMDVAPEISSDRTMLPARYVAEAFGYVVGWDPGTSTILISK